MARVTINVGDNLTEEVTLTMSMLSGETGEIYFNTYSGAGLIIDWGDGTTNTVTTFAQTNTNHTYTP